MTLQFPVLNSIVKQPRIILGHQVFTKGEWKRARQQEHPRVVITISIDSSEQAKYNEHTHYTAKGGNTRWQHST